MALKLRVKELALKKDGTDIWFYPEICIEEKRQSGILWWRKEFIIENWIYFTMLTGKSEPWDEKKHSVKKLFAKNFDAAIIAFRNIDEALKWIGDYKQKQQKEDEVFSEIFWKDIGATVESGKIHEV